MPTDTKPSPDVHAQLEQAAAEVVDLDQQLATLASAGDAVSMEPIVEQREQKLSLLDRLRTIVARLDDAAAAKQQAEVEGLRQVEAERQRQARLELESQFAALERELREALITFELHLVNARQSLHQVGQLTVQLAPLAQELGEPFDQGWPHELLRRMLFRARHVFRGCADSMFPGLGNQLFPWDGITLGEKPLVTFAELES